MLNDGFPYITLAVEKPDAARPDASGLFRFDSDSKRHLDVAQEAGVCRLPLYSRSTFHDGEGRGT